MTDGPNIGDFYNDKRIAEADDMYDMKEGVKKRLGEMDMSMKEALENEEALQKIIRDTITDICEKKNVHYPNICSIASRSASGKKKVVDQIMEILTSGDTKSSLEQALAQVNGFLG